MGGPCVLPAPLGARHRAPPPDGRLHIARPHRRRVFERHGFNGKFPKENGLTDIPQIPGLLRVIFCPIESRRNEIRSHLTVLAAKSLDWPPRSVGTRRLAFIRL